MGHIVRGYRIGQGGRIDRQIFDSDRFPEGWYDSPSKIPGYVGEFTVGPSVPHAAPVTTGEVYGERRKPGWPKGKPRK